jgi:hypothetical protein
MPRTPAQLSNSLHKQLNMYALAATAAGVGVLALTQPAKAKIVYTSAYTKLPINAYLPVDLNHDGVTDFSLFLSFYQGKEGSVHSLSVHGVAQANQVWWTKTSRYYCAAALPKRTVVGPKAPFLPGKFPMFRTGTGGVRRDFLHVGECRAAIPRAEVFHQR